MSRFRIPLLILLVGTFASACGPVLPEGPENFYAFPIPTNNYKVGDVVAIFTSPRYQIDPVTRPDTDSMIEETSSPLTLSTNSRRQASVTLSANVADALQSEMSSGTISEIEATYSNVRTVTAFQDDLRSALISRLSTNPGTCDTVRDNIDDGIHMDVIVSVVVADPQIVLYDSTESRVNVDPDVIRRLDAKLNASFRQSSDGTVVGEGLGVGFTYNPRLTERVFREACGVED